MVDRGYYHHNIMKLARLMPCITMVYLACCCASTTTAMALSSNNYESVDIGSNIMMSRLDFMIKSSSSSSSSFLVLSSSSQSALSSLGPLISSSAIKPPSSNQENGNIEIPLVFLPNGGCYAMKVSLSDASGDNQLSYYAIVDTASPFLTTPNNEKFRRILKKKPSQREYRQPTYEQYGDIVGEMEWKQVDYISVIGKTRLVSTAYDGSDNNNNNNYIAQGIVQEQSNVVVGLPTTEVIQETGGIIFVGLMYNDKNRPTFLQQLHNYKSFTIDFRKPSLYLTKASLIKTPPNDNNNKKKKNAVVMDLFNLQSYGPNVYHYGVICDNLELVLVTNDSTSKNPITMSIPCSTTTLSRPVVAILDTGLTGCVINDTLYNEIIFKNLNKDSSDDSTATDDDDQKPVKIDIQGIKVSLRCSSSSVSSPTAATSGKKEEGDTTTTTTTTIDISSSIETSPQYFRCSTFHLPWFYEDDEEIEEEESAPSSRQRPLPPHIIALGNTFWTNPNNGIQSLTIDTNTQKAKIEF